MCRLTAYLGKPLLVDDVLYKPENSLIKQSVHALETREPLNGDGFGVGWYAHDIDDVPGLFKSIRPAWNDVNLQYLAKKIRTSCFLAHVRAASVGGVTQANSHPFHYERLLCMHNGGIGEFEKIQRHLRHSLSDNIYNWIKGHTDSEHFFALFLEHLQKRNEHFNVKNAAHVLRLTIKKIEELSEKYGVTKPSFLNIVLSNGKSMVASRYVTDPALEPRTLYYAAGKEYRHDNGSFHMEPDQSDQNEAVLIVSEKLTDCVADWKLVPANHVLLVHEDLGVDVEKL